MGTATRILLLRHAHAAWAQPGIADFDRPLDARGVEDAGLMGRAIAARGLAPDIILCSPANRCVQTCDIVTGSLPDETLVRQFDELYSSDHDFYLRLLSQQQASTILLIGHNPMMEDTARELAITAETWPAHRLQKGFPTAGIAIVDIAGSTGRTQFSGHLSEFLTPKRLKKRTEGEQA